jgi:hypothetical protein
MSKNKTIKKLTKKLEKLDSSKEKITKKLIKVTESKAAKTAKNEAAKKAVVKKAPTPTTKSSEA